MQQQNPLDGFAHWTILITGCTQSVVVCAPTSRNQHTQAGKDQERY